MNKFVCPICQSKKTKLKFVYKRKCSNENFFAGIHDSPGYKRILHICINCGHIFESFVTNHQDLYSGQYSHASYTNYEGIQANFKRIKLLQRSKSDNKLRVEFIMSYFQNINLDTFRMTLLDIGSGIGIFPFQVKDKFKKVVALDIDPLFVKHLKEIGIQTHFGLIESFPTNYQLDFITINKVLEHLKDPIKLINQAKKRISKSGGFIYFEIPDGESASKFGKCREEFLLGHMHAFSFMSLLKMIEKTRLEICFINRLKEASGKYTFRVLVRTK